MRFFLVLSALAAPAVAAQCAIPPHRRSREGCSDVSGCYPADTVAKVDALFTQTVTCKPVVVFGSESFYSLEKPGWATWIDRRPFRRHYPAYVNNARFDRSGFAVAWFLATASFQNMPLWLFLNVTDFADTFGLNPRNPFTLTDRVTRDLPAQPVRFEVAVDRFPRSVVTDTDWRQWVEHLDMYYEFPHSEYGSNDRMRAAVARLWRYDSQDRARNFFNMYRILRELYFLSGERLVFHTRTFDEARFLRYRAIWWSSDPVSKMDETPFYAACLQTPEMHALKFELTDTFKALSCKCDVPAPVNRALTFTCHRPRAPRREVRNMTLLYVHQPAVHTEARDFQAASSHRPTEFFCVSDVKESLKEANRDVSGALPPFASSLHDHLRATGTPTTPDRPVPHPYKTAMAVSSGTCACTPHGAQDVRMWQIRASEACAGHGRCAPSAANSLVSECVCDETHRRPSQAELANARLEVDAARREYRGPAASAHYLDELGDVCSIERCAVQTSREAGERLVPLFVPSVPKDVCGPGRCRRHPVRGEFGCECPAGTFPPFCSQPLC